MKKLYVLMCATAMTMTMSFSAFAAQNDKAANQEIRSEIKETKQDIKEIETQMKTVQADNKALSAELKAMKAAKKNGTSDLSAEEWQTVQGLSAQLKELRTELKSTDGTAKTLRTEARAGIKEKNWSHALEKLNQAEETKKGRLELKKEINTILTQITAID